MLQELFEKYAKEICSTCIREKCDKGICVVQGKEIKVQCVDYLKDETKIKPIEKDLITTAKHTAPVMKNFI